MAYICDPSSLQGFPYALSGTFDLGAPVQCSHQVHTFDNTYEQFSPETPSIENEHSVVGKLQAFCCKRDNSSEEGDFMQTVEDQDEGIVPPVKLSLPRSLLPASERVSDNEDEDSCEAESKKAKKRRKKKLNKKKKKQAEMQDPRLDVNYWIAAPRAAECCIAPIEDFPLPYELLAVM